MPEENVARGSAVLVPFPLYRFFGVPSPFDALQRFVSPCLANCAPLDCGPKYYDFIRILL
jgi:hypothetical protein